MKHRLFLPPAEVGQSLPHEIVEAYKKKKNLPADNEGGPHPVDSGTCKSGHDLNYISEEHSGSNVSLGPSVSQAVVDAHPHLARAAGSSPQLHSSSSPNGRGLSNLSAQPRDAESQLQ